jgi:hypothetical protein
LDLRAHAPVGGDHELLELGAELNRQLRRRVERLISEGQDRRDVERILVARIIGRLGRLAVVRGRRHRVAGRGALVPPEALFIAAHPAARRRVRRHVLDEVLDIDRP